jgi:hypothetical protein
VRKDFRNLFQGKYDREPLRLFRPNHTLNILAQRPFQDFPVKKYQGVKRLILRSGRNVALYRQMRKERSYLLLPHIGGMTFTMEMDKAPDPIHIRLFRPDAVMAHTNGLRDALQKRG